MLRRSLALGSCLAATLVVVGCQDQTTAPASVGARAASTAQLQLQSSLRYVVDRSARLSSDNAADLSFTTGHDAINPKNYVCSSASPLNDWLNAKLDNTITTEGDIFFTLYDLAADEVPTYEALFFQSSATPQTFGYSGELTHTIGKVERDVKRFWDIPSANIQVVAMHGTVLLDIPRVAATYQYVFGIPEPDATMYATIVHDALLSAKTMDGNYPFWTFNAVSYRGGDLADKPMSKVVMGDGIMEGYQELGFGDVAPQAIFAHEYAHQIQFEKGYRLASGPGVSAAERTRFTELHADASSAYYLTHSRGAAMNRKRVEEFLQVFYQIGDCSFSSSGHHGTPNQRLAAARFGFSVADQAQKQGHILTAAQFYALFLAQYPTLIAPDAPHP